MELALDISFCWPTAPPAAVAARLDDCEFARPSKGLHLIWRRQSVLSTLETLEPARFCFKSSLIAMSRDVDGPGTSEFLLLRPCRGIGRGGIRIGSFEAEGDFESDCD